MSRIAVILGVGPGLSASLARRLTETHKLVLLSRSLPDSFPKLNLDISDKNYLALPSDGSRPSLDTAISEAQQKWPEGTIDLGIFNTGGGFSPGPFLSMNDESLRGNFEKNVIAAFHFGQALLPQFLKNEEGPKGAKGTLIFTGATMSIRGGANFSTMAPTMFARRALAQSLAREFGPQGVHVAHVILDGRIGQEGVEDGQLDPVHIAETYLSLINQHKSTWTQELDLRPFNEKW